jgi:hypothetical protein
MALPFRLLSSRATGVHSEPHSTRIGRDCVGTTKSMADTMLFSSRTKEASLRRRACIFEYARASVAE